MTPDPDSGPVHDPPVTVMCEACGAVIEVNDVRSFLLALHLTTNCVSTEPLRAPLA